MLHLGPLRVHWSLLLGAALFCALDPRPLLLAGYACVLAAHVAGHALASARTGLHVTGVMVHALGGELLGEGEATPLRRSVIALGGVAAQAALLLAALALAMPQDLHDAFVRRNGILLLMNLIPVRPLDGALAWKLPARLRASRRTRFRERMRSSRAVQEDVEDLLRKIRGGTRVR